MNVQLLLKIGVNIAFPEGITHVRSACPKSPGDKPYRTCLIHTTILSVGMTVGMKFSLGCTPKRDYLKSDVAAPTYFSKCLYFIIGMGA